MDINLFDFYLPEELIAQSPLKERENCKLLVINKKEKNTADRHFFDILEYFKEGDVLVRNNTKVIPARLFAVKENTGAHVEVLLLKDLGNDTWKCLCGNAKAIKTGVTLIFNGGLLKGTCVKREEEGIRHIKFEYEGIFLEVLDKIGQMPLPPYIHAVCEDKSDYQTVYAKVEGSEAAPTDGFHFTDELLEKLKQKGVTIVDVTLHIGLGTFRPVKVQDTDDHVMHSEEYEISEGSAAILNKAMAENRRIFAVGTTSVRTLEANYSKYGKIVPTVEATNIFIYPGYKWNVVDCLITNFHLPKSTLIMLVSSFIGDREYTLECYKHAVEDRYRFFSFGDAMFIYE